MEIEIYGSSVIILSNSLTDLKRTILDTISDLQSAVNRTYNLPGGAGAQTGAASDLQRRINRERDKQSDVENFKGRILSFTDLVITIDGNVAASLVRNKNEFYRVNDWARPSVNTEKSFFESVGDFFNNAWNGIKTFYADHKKVIDTTVIVITAAVAIAGVVLSGGLAAGPLLAGLGWLAIGSTAASAGMNIIDTWAEIDNPIFNAIQTTLNITSFATTMMFGGGLSTKPFYVTTGLIGAGTGMGVGAGVSFYKYGELRWQTVLAGTAIGGGLGIATGMVVSLVKTGKLNSTWLEMKWNPIAKTIPIDAHSQMKGAEFEKVVYKMEKIPETNQQVPIKNVGRLDGLKGNTVIECKNYDWAKPSYQGSKINGIIKDFSKQAEKYLRVDGIKKVKFYFSSKPPQAVITSLEKIKNVIVRW